MHTYTAIFADGQTKTRRTRKRYTIAWRAYRDDVPHTYFGFAADERRADGATYGYRTRGWTVDYVNLDPPAGAYPLTAREFPNYPIASLPPIPDGWQEMSWHNDTAPSFGIMHPDDNRPLLQVYVDYPDPTMREFPDTDYRYVLIVGDSRDVTTSNDWDTILAAADAALA